MSLVLMLQPADPAIQCFYRPINDDLDFVGFTNGVHSVAQRNHFSAIDVDVPIRDFCQIIKDIAKKGLADIEGAEFAVVEMILTAHEVDGWNFANNPNAKRFEVGGDIEDVNKMIELALVAPEPVVITPELSIGMADFLSVVQYVFQNGDIRPNDARVALIQEVRQMAMAQIQK